MLKLIKAIKGRFTLANTSEERNKWSAFLRYVVVSYVLSLRGVEGFMLDIDLTYRLRDRNDGSYQTIGLMRRVKEETHDRCHLVLWVTMTGSGIQVRKILMRHLRLKKSQGLTSGPAISNKRRKLLLSREIIKMLIEALENLYEDKPSECSLEVDSKDKLADAYHCF